MQEHVRPLDDLKEQENEVRGQNGEGQAIIQDENTSLADREAAEAPLQTQMAGRERARPVFDYLIIKLVIVYQLI